MTVSRDRRVDGRLTTALSRARKAGANDAQLAEVSSWWQAASETDRTLLAAKSTRDWVSVLAGEVVSGVAVTYAGPGDSELVAGDVGPLAGDYPPPAVQVGERPDDAHPGEAVGGFLADGLGAAVTVDLDEVPEKLADLREWVGDDVSRARAALVADRLRRNGRPRSTVVALAREVAGPDV